MALQRTSEAGMSSQLLNDRSVDHRDCRVAQKGPAMFAIAPASGHEDYERCAEPLVGRNIRDDSPCGAREELVYWDLKGALLCVLMGGAACCRAEWSGGCIVTIVSRLGSACDTDSPLGVARVGFALSRGFPPPGHRICSLQCLPLVPSDASTRQPTTKRQWWRAFRKR